MIYKEKKEKSMNTIKKHIIISGVPRTGKTKSICRKLAETSYYQHVMMDSITQSFEYIFPQLEIFDFSYNREKKTEEIVKYILEDNGYKSWN